MALYETLRFTPPLIATTHRVAVLSTVGRVRRGASVRELGVADALARAMSSRTGRDCAIDEVDTHALALEPAGYDAVAITLSVTAAAAPPVGWQQNLRALLQVALPSIPAGTPIIVGVPVPHPAAPTHTLRARLAERRRYRFTNEVATILNVFGRGELVALPLPADRSAHAFGSPDRDRLAGALADRLAPRLLQAGHDAAARRLQLTA